MTDLRVNYAALEDSQRDLQTIKSEFENCARRKDELRGVWGSGDVADAMGEFVDNWDRHRKELVEQLTAVGDMVTNTLQTFRDTDEKLAANCQGD